MRWALGGVFFMHYLNHAHSDLFITNEAHLSENEIKGLSGILVPIGRLLAQTTMLLPPCLVLASDRAEWHARNGRGLTGSKEHGSPLSHLLGCVTLRKSHPLAESVPSLVNDSPISEYLINASFSSPLPFGNARKWFLKGLCEFVSITN